MCCSISVAVCVARDSVGLSERVARFCSVFVALVCVAECVLQCVCCSVCVAACVLQEIFWAVKKSFECLWPQSLPTRVSCQQLDV